MVCFGNMFVELPKARTKEMMQKGTETPIRMEMSRATLPCCVNFWQCPKTLTKTGHCHCHTAQGTVPEHILAQGCQKLSACGHSGLRWDLEVQEHSPGRAPSAPRSALQHRASRRLCVVPMRTPKPLLLLIPVPFFSDQEHLDEEINKLRKELRVKVNRLYEAQGKRFCS